MKGSLWPLFILPSNIPLWGKVFFTKLTTKKPISISLKKSLVLYLSLFMLKQRINISALVVILINDKCLWLSWKSIDLIIILRDVEILVGASAMINVLNSSIGLAWFFCIKKISDPRNFLACSGTGETLHVFCRVPCVMWQSGERSVNHKVKTYSFATQADSNFNL